MEGHFQEKIPFETQSRKKIAKGSDSEKIQVFFEKKPSISGKNPNSERFENFYHSNCILPILPQICYKLLEKIIFTFRREQNADVDMNAIGKYRVKKRQKQRIWEEDFEYGAK